MGARTSYAPGTFSWVDLGTVDLEGAKDFYRRMFAWEPADTPAGEGGTYTMLRRDGRDVAGMYELSPETLERGVPPHWLSYVTVADIVTTAARVRELGGTVVSGPFEVMDAGGMAVILDPQGAMLALWEPRRHAGARVVNEPGALCWNDLIAADAEAAASFYVDLFGWSVEPIAGGAYWTIRNGNATNGGILPLEGLPPVWNAYFATGDLDASLSTAVEAGGSTMMEPREVPAGRFAAVKDPQGAVISLFEGTLDP